MSLGTMNDIKEYDHFYRKLRTRMHYYAEIYQLHYTHIFRKCAR